MKTKKLTPAILSRLILECLEERNIPFKSSYEAQKHKRESQAERDKERKKREEIMPAYASLKALGSGVLQEGELVEIEEDEEFVKIHRKALNRLLTENKEKLKSVCNQNGFHTIEHFLRLQNLINKSEKGTLLKPDKK